MTTQFEFGDIFDSRDVVKRLEELREERNIYRDTKMELNNDLSVLDTENVDDKEKIERLEEEIEDNEKMCPSFDEGDELETLGELETECSTESEWASGLQFISESYFKEYAKQYAEDIGAITGNETWPCTYIDWGEAVEDLLENYSEVDIDGKIYYYRDY